MSYTPKFDKTFCSQCGGEFGPGDHGFSHCENHGHVCSSPLATRHILYNDTIGGKEVHVDHLWAVTTRELNDAHRAHADALDALKVAREALIRYAKHDKGCPAEDGYHHPLCTCGMNAALAAMGKP